MSLIIIADYDANILENKLRSCLQYAVKEIQTISPHNFLRNETIRTQRSVCIVILTSLLWREIQRHSHDQIRSVFVHPSEIVVLAACTKSIRRAVTDMFSAVVDNWKEIGIYEASEEEWYQAEARIKYRLSKLAEREIEIPSASRYIIKPDTITTMSQAQEVLLILFEDDTDNTALVESVTVSAVGVDLKMEARKIQSNVWSFQASDFGCGSHEIHVFADNTDLGTHVLSVQDHHQVMKHEFRKLKEEDPETFVAELLNLDKPELDLELADTLDGSSTISVIETLLKFGEENECEYPSLLHFCAKHGHQACITWCQKHYPNFQQACMVKDKDGNTPEQLALGSCQNQLFIRKLQASHSDPEELEPLPSPFGQGSDSGRSSLGSSGSVDPDGSAIGDGQRYRFARRTSHPYCDIGEEEQPYSRPWDSKTPMFPDRIAHSMSAGDLSDAMIVGARPDRRCHEWPVGDMSENSEENGITTTKKQPTRGISRSHTLSKITRL